MLSDTQFDELPRIETGVGQIRAECLYAQCDKTWSRGILLDTSKIL